jgi:hypothetical protein
VLRPRSAGTGVAEIFHAGHRAWDWAQDGQRFAVFTMLETAAGEKGSVHVTFLLNFLDELRRRIPAGK